jgi:hypothetical protein
MEEVENKVLIRIIRNWAANDILNSASQANCIS